MNCPKCGADAAYSGEYGIHFQCDSELLLKYPFAESGTSFREDKCCLYRQLAAVTAERDALLVAAKYAYKQLDQSDGLHPWSIIGVKVLDKLLPVIAACEQKGGE